MTPVHQPEITLYTNGRICQLDAFGNIVWKEALLVDGERILAIGSHSDFSDQGGIYRIIDLSGARLFPGFCDAHLHLAAGGQSLGITDLSYLDAAAVERALQAAASLAFDGRRWLEAFNWDEDLAVLDADLLSEWVPDQPLIVHKRDLHSCCCNRKALDLAGITKLIPDPAGGHIGRTGNGDLNGMLFESAIALLSRNKPAPTLEERKDYILAGQEFLIKQGITAISEVLDKGNEEIYRSLDESNLLKIDVDGWLRIGDWDGKSRPYRLDRFQVNTLKLFLDGSFGSRTAALNTPFTDNPAESGMLFYSDEDLLKIAEKANSLRWRLAVHAIGDRAAEQACRVLASAPYLPNAPHRIEHLQLLPENGVELVAKSHAVASMQPVHLLDDQDWLPERIGVERCRRSFIWRSLLERDVTIAVGSDWPVASPDPKLNLHAMINRARFGAKAGSAFDQSEALTPAQAIRTISEGYALAASRRGERGSILPGMQADFTIVSGLDDDLIDWSDARTVMTVTRGVVVFDLLNTIRKS